VLAPSAQAPSAQAPSAQTPLFAFGDAQPSAKAKQAIKKKNRIVFL